MTKGWFHGTMCGAVPIDRLGLGTGLGSYIGGWTKGVD